VSSTALRKRKNIVQKREDIEASFESTTITIKHGSKEIHITSMYKSSSTPLLINDVEILEGYYGGLLLAAGDLNAKHQSWNGRVTNQADRVSNEHMESFQTSSIYAADSPTNHSFNPLHSLEVLDITLIILSQSEYTLTNHNELKSDNNPIVMTIRLPYNSQLLS